MRLRYLRVRNNPPLNDVAITFNHEAALGRACAINFIVGINGSGKSRLLQVIAEIFLELSRQQLPSYPVTLAYDLSTGTNARTILLHHPTRQASDAVFIEYANILPDHTEWGTLHERTENERQRYPGTQLPGPTYLPSALLAYTSGATASWRRLFERRKELFTTGIEAARSNPDIEERPANWNAWKEAEHLRREGRTDEANLLLEALLQSDTNRRFQSDYIIFVTAEDLKLALFAVVLDHARNEFRQQMSTKKAERRFLERINQAVEENTRMPGFRGILNAVDWLYPVTVSLRLTRQLEDLSNTLKDQAKRQKLQALYQIATRAVREPEPTEQRFLVFDLRRPLTEPPNSGNTSEPADADNTTVAALIEALGDENATPFEVFNQLRTWRHEGLLEDVLMIIRKRNVDDLLLYDWLSDGEQVFLGRMALFHLLQGRGGAGQDDALVLLDEPETHFNDVWKREMVDIIDDCLGNLASNVLITTHSSIALTDVFNTEIVLLKKNLHDGSVEVAREIETIKTFGASPTEIMRSIFGAREGVGQRAAQFLDLLLTVAAYPDTVEAVWKMNGNDVEIRQSQQFQVLWEALKKLPHHYGGERFLLEVLRAVYRYAQDFAEKAEVTVMDAMNALQDKLGPGYYEFEFLRRLQELKKREANAPQN